MLVKLFSCKFFSFPLLWMLSRALRKRRLEVRTEEDWWLVRKSLSRLETLQSTPPLFFQLNFLKRPILREICSKSFKMLGIAFCGNGFIHLNIAEFHEEDIGGQKTCAYFDNQGSK